MMEHRWSQRVAAALPVVLVRPDGATLQGTAIDVSNQGLFVETDGAVWRNTYLEVRFSVPGHGNGVYRLLGLVVRVTETGAGLQMDNLTPGARNALRSLVENSGNSSDQLARAS